MTDKPAVSLDDVLALLERVWQLPGRAPANDVWEALRMAVAEIRALPTLPGAGEGLTEGRPMNLGGLSPEERLVWLLGDMMNAAENYYGAPNPKREGHIYCTANRIIDEVIEPLRARERSEDAPDSSEEFGRPVLIGEIGDPFP